MPSMRTAIAAATTVLALGALTTLAVSAGSTSTPASDAGTTTAPAPAVRPPTVVRTVVVTKVIHRTRRAKAPRPSAPAAVAPAPAPAPVAAPATVVHAAVPTASVVAPTRVARPHGSDDEHEGGSDD